MNQLKMIWDKYIAVFYYLYSVIIHSILMFAALFSVFLGFGFLPENTDFECAKTTMREIGGFLLLIIIPFISFIFRFLFLSQNSLFNKMAEKKNLLTTGILDIITIFALFLFYFIYSGYSFSLKEETYFILFLHVVFFFLFFSNFVSILLFSLIQKFRNWKKSDILNMIFFVIFLIVNQFIGFLFLLAIVFICAFFYWDNIDSSLIFLYIFAFVYAIIFQIFDSKIYYYLKLIEDKTIVVKTFLFLKSLLFILIFLCTLLFLE